MYIDSHAHLFDEQLQTDLDDVLVRARESGIAAIVVPGTTIKTSERALELSEKHEFVFACVGIHPHEAGDAAESDFERLRRLADHPKAVAIGEIGLDYHYDFAPRDVQMSVFRRQLEVAAGLDLPVVVHTRESIPDAILAVRSAVDANQDWRDPGKNSGAEGSGRGVFHCFTGTAEQARELFAMNLTVSYPGIVTFKNSPVLGTLKEIGYQRILLETDSPYLTPAPHRGKRNEPSYLPLIANTIADLFGVAPSDIARQTTLNAQALFSLPE